MLMLVTYDVGTTTAAGRKRLRRVARACLDFGQRVQNSVFECEVDPAQWAALRARLVGEIDPGADSLRFYRLGRQSRANPSLTPEFPVQQAKCRAIVLIRALRRAARPKLLSRTNGLGPNSLFIKAGNYASPCREWPLAEEGMWVSVQRTHAYG